MRQSTAHFNCSVLDELDDPALVAKCQRVREMNNLPEVFIDKEFLLVDQANPTIYFQHLTNLIKDYRFKHDENMKPSDHYKDSLVLSALKILQSHLDLVTRLFITKDPPLNHCWAVWYCDAGAWKLMELDENVPCTLRGNQALLATIGSELCWPILLEKVIAKYYGNSYTVFNQQALALDSVLYLLTGLPIQKVTTEDMRQVQLLISSQRGMDNRMYASKFFGTDQIGYLVEDLQFEGTDVLISLQAPSLPYVLKGKKKLNYLTRFSLTIEEFQQEFKEISVLRYHKAFLYHFLKMEPIFERQAASFSESGFGYQFTIQQTSYGYLSICQSDVGPSRDQDAPPRYALIRLLVCRMEEQDSLTFVTGNFNNEQTLSVELEFEPGEYRVLVQAYFLGQDARRQLVLQFYGEEKVELRKLPDSVNYRLYCRSVLISLAMSESTSENTRTMESLGQPNIQVTAQMNLGLLLIYYRNFGTQTLEEWLSFELLENFIEEDSQTQKSEFHNVVAPHTDHLIAFVFDPPITYSTQPTFQYKCKIKSLLENNQNESQVCSLGQSQVKNGDASAKLATLDLIQFMKEHGKKAQRVWDDRPVDVYFYIYQHKQGVVLLYLNYSTLQYEEKLTLELNNLTVKCKRDLIKNNAVHLQLDKYSQLFVYLEVEAPHLPFDYKLQSSYKCFQ